MNLVENKKNTSAFFASMRRNDTGAISELMTEDAAWIAPGTNFSGLLTKVEYLHSIRWLHSLALSPVEMVFQEIAAEDDHVAIIWATPKGRILNVSRFGGKIS